MNCIGQHDREPDNEEPPLPRSADREQQPDASNHTPRNRSAKGAEGGIKRSDDSE